MSKLKGKAPESIEPGKTKGLIFGASGVGKTWFTLDFPAPYYVDTEGGADLRHYQDRLKKAGGVYMGQEDGALDFATIIDQIKIWFFFQSFGRPGSFSKSFKTIIIWLPIQSTIE